MTSAVKIYVTARARDPLLISHPRYKGINFKKLLSIVSSTEQFIFQDGNDPLWLFACLVKLISFSTINRLIVSLTGLTPEVTVEKVPFCRNGSSLEREELRRQWLNPFACRKRQKGCKNFFNKHFIPSVNFLLWNIEHWLKQTASLMQRTKFRPIQCQTFLLLYFNLLCLKIIQ